MIAFHPPALHARAPVQSPIDIEKCLRCVAVVESGNDDRAIGAAGERGRYQIKESTWRMHMNSATPFRYYAHSYSTAHVCAMRHIWWIIGKLTQHNLPVTVESCASVWNVGLDGYCRSLRITEAAQRVANLYNSP